MSYAYFNVSPPVQRYLNVQFSGLGAAAEGAPESPLPDLPSDAVNCADCQCPAGYVRGTDNGNNCVCGKEGLPGQPWLWADCAVVGSGSSELSWWDKLWGASLTSDMQSTAPSASSPTPAFFPDVTGGSSSQPATPGAVATSPTALPFWGMAAGAVLVGLGIGIMFGGDR